MLPPLADQRTQTVIYGVYWHVNNGVYEVYILWHYVTLKMCAVQQVKPNCVNNIKVPAQCTLVIEVKSLPRGHMTFNCILNHSRHAVK